MKKTKGIGYEGLLLNIFFDIGLDDILPLRDDDKELIENSLKKFQPRAQKIIRMRYGIGMDFHTLKQAGDKMNVGAQRIRQIQMKTIRKLRYPEYASPLKKLIRPYLDTLIKELTEENKKLRKKEIALLNEIKQHEKISLEFIEGCRSIKSPIFLENIIQHLVRSVYEFDLSIRAENCLRSMKIVTISDLVRKSEREILKNRGVGRKTFNDLKKLLESLDLHFGMNLDY